MKKFLMLLLLTNVLFISLTFFSGCDATQNTSNKNNSNNDYINISNNIKLNDYINCTNTTIKASSSTYIITPAGFDFNTLNLGGYKMSIKVTYDVYYSKDWNVLWDIGYLGAPKYEVFILDNDLIGKSNENIVAPEQSTARNITYTTDVINLINSKLTLTFSSDNIQNKIHFRNISVTYKCYK